MTEKTIHFTREQLDALTPEEREIIMKMIRAGGKVSGTAVVKRADGTVKYDDEILKGSYGEDDGANT